jgi:hypothetical protein
VNTIGREVFARGFETDADPGRPPSEETVGHPGVTILFENDQRNAGKPGARHRCRRGIAAQSDDDVDAAAPQFACGDQRRPGRARQGAGGAEGSATDRAGQVLAEELEAGGRHRAGFDAAVGAEEDDLRGASRLARQLGDRETGKEVPSRTASGKREPHQSRSSRERASSIPVMARKIIIEEPP